MLQRRTFINNLLILAIVPASAIMPIVGQNYIIKSLAIGGTAHAV